MNNKNKIYSLSELQLLLYDVFEKHGIKKAYIFGSYAREEANVNSDVDIMIDCGELKSLFQLSNLAIDIENKLNKEVDIVTESTYTDDIIYDNESLKLAKNIFFDEVKKERKLIYG